jgi:hypothetical protein
MHADSRRVTLPIASLALIVLVPLLGGCATMVDGSTQELSFQANPDGVAVTLLPAPPPPPPPSEWRADGATSSTKRQVSTQATPVPRLLGVTPLKVILDRSQGQLITFTKNGYKPLVMQLTTRTNPAFWGNIAIGGLIGSSIDNATGAALEYVPNQYFVTLIPLEATSIERTTGQAQRDKAIVFIVRRYAAIMADLSRGSGEDWTSLLGVLQIGPGQDAEARDKIRAFATIYPDAANFATHVADFYLNH